jgi:transposase
MKLQDVILRAIAKRITWLDAAEIAGVSPRTIAYLRRKYENYGYDGLYQQQRRKRFVYRVPLTTAEKVLDLYQQQYAGFSAWRFHRKLSSVYGIQVRYDWVKQALQGAGLL